MNDEEKSPLYFANLYSDKRININQGGTSSGKTFSILDVLFTLGASKENQVITVVGQDIPNLKKGAYRDAKHIWGSSKIYQQYFQFAHVLLLLNKDYVDGRKLSI